MQHNKCLDQSVGGKKQVTKNLDIEVKLIFCFRLMTPVRFQEYSISGLLPVARTPIFLQVVSVFSLLARIGGGGGGGSTIQFPPALYNFQVEISSRTPIPPLKPGSVYSGSAS